MALSKLMMPVKWGKKYPAAFFMVTFVVLTIAFYIFYFLPFFQIKIVFPLVSLYAQVSHMLLQLLGYQTEITGYAISSSKLTLEIRQGCDAVEAMGLLIAGIVAFPVTFRKKLRGIVIGISILFVLNIIRIISLFIAGLYSQSLFETLHVVVWQIIFILVPVGLWLFWMRRAIAKPQVA